MPETKNTTFRAAVLTIWDMTWDQSLPDKLTYIASCKEVAPTTGKEHFQAFAYAEKPMRLTGWIKVFKHLKPSTYIAEQRGTFTQNAQYCSKQGSLLEHGVRPMENGHKRSILQIKDAIDTGEKLEDIVQQEEHFATVMQYKNGLQWYEQIKVGQKRKAEGFKPPEVHVIIGPAGCGKTREVYDKEGFSIYSMPRHDMKWCGSYNGQRVVLFDDVRADTIMSIDHFLRIADGYPIEVECKNGFRYWTVEKIYLTSNQDMELWWPKATPEDRAAVARRITSHRNSYYREPLADESPQRAAA
uniref:Replication-associated protein n=1 Tax=Cressdnaviricota sp. TaxID=2748378 RepID=A0A6M9Z753_9VIRU|nr:MAG: replication-associated protein [Cressdnaviricota sp.]QKN88880.1 MAG: replication-associated protein [Cressdnaviricota sp.]